MAWVCRFAESEFEIGRPTPLPIFTFYQVHHKHIDIIPASQLRSFVRCFRRRRVSPVCSVAQAINAVLLSELCGLSLLPVPARSIMFPSLTLSDVKIGVHARILDVVAVSFFTWTLIRLARNAHRRARTTRLNGPPSKNLVLGFPEFFSSPHSPEIYEDWAEEYGAVYQLPSVLGTARIILCDPKAVAHFYAKETTTYILTPLGRFLTGIVVRFLKVVLRVSFDIW